MIIIKFLKNKGIWKNEYIFSMISQIFMVVLGMIESALLARYLGAELRGTLSYIYSMASTAYLVITFGIYTVYPFRRKDSKINRQELLDEFMTVSCIMFLFYFLVLSILGLFILSKNSLNMGLILLMLPIMGYDKVVTFVSLIEHPNRMNGVNVCVNILQCVYLVVLTSTAERSLIAGVCYYLLGCIIKAIYFSVKLHFHIHLKYFHIKTLLKYMSFGFFQMLTLLFTTLNYRLDIIMLKHYDYITLAQVGIYSIGITLSEKALLIPNAIKDVLLSKLAKGKGTDEVVKTMRICFLASIFTAAIITILGRIFIQVMYGAEYAGAEEVTYISVWGTIVMVFFKMISQYNVVQHKQYLNIILLSVSIAVNAMFNTILIPSYGINGAAIATVIGHIVCASIFLIYFRNIAGTSIFKMVVIQKQDVFLLKKMINNENN